MMKTGFARCCVTPPLGTSISGYYESRSVKGTIDDLFVTALTFDDGENKAVIIAADVLMLSYNQCNLLKKGISEAVGISADSILINCSHTHTGPYLNGEKLSSEKVSDDYIKQFESAITEVSKKAFLDMRNSVFSVGCGKAEKISFIRRYKMKNGTTATNPGVNNPDIEKALGTPNETVKFLRIDRDGGENLVLVSFGTHADTIGGEYVSADWPGFVRSTVEGAIENTKCIFLTSPQGDVNHINVNPTDAERRGLDYETFDGVPRGYEHAKHMGRVVAAAVLSSYGKAEVVKCEKLKFDNLEISIPANSEDERYEEALKITELHMADRASELPYEKMELTTVVAEAYRIVELKNGPKEFKFVLSALSLGSVAFVGMPGECFVEIGRRIEAESEFAATFVCCLTNGGETYFPTSKAYDEGGYEARTSRLKKGGDNILVENAIALSKKIK